MSDERAVRRAKRAAALERIPAHYNPHLHLAATVGVGVSLLVAGIVFVRAPRWWEWLVVPFMVVFANGFEWVVHKYVLHKRRRGPFAELFERHTPTHHVYYVEDDMEIGSVREFHFVLIPAIGVVGAVGVATPLALLLGFVISSNAGWLVLITAGIYMVAYELSHLSYHLPERSFFGRRAWVARLRKHHAKHHDPKMMQRYNFNITLPLFDWILGTYHRAGDASVKPARDSA